MKEVKSKIEAILFCSPQGVELKKIAKLCSIGSKGHVKSILNAMKEDFDKRGAGVEILEENGLWKFKVKDDHLNLVKEAARPEIEKSILETLAYIAHKGSTRQSDVIKIRSNKAYKHIEELKKLGFVESKKKGTTKMINLTKKFYNYFNLEEGETLGVE
jgi:segregation and condensation protein B